MFCKQASPGNDSSLSLSRALLSLSSLGAQQRVLHYMIQALQTQLCRDAIVAAFNQQQPSMPAQQQQQPPTPPPQQPQQPPVLLDSPQSSNSEGSQTCTNVDLYGLLKHKEMVALWQLLKLSAQQQPEADRTRTLTNVLLGIVSCFYMIFVEY